MSVYTSKVCSTETTEEQSFGYKSFVRGNSLFQIHCLESVCGLAPLPGDCKEGANRVLCVIRQTNYYPKVCAQINSSTMVLNCAELSELWFPFHNSIIIMSVVFGKPAPAPLLPPHWSNLVHLPASLSVPWTESLIRLLISFSMKFNTIQRNIFISRDDTDSQEWVGGNKEEIYKYP